MEPCEATPDASSDTDCEHVNREHRVRRDAWQRPLIALQCISCGERLSEDVSPKAFTAEQIAGMPPWDHERLAARRAKAKKSRSEERQFQQQVQHELQVEQQRDDYNRYLASPEWQALRRKVFARADGICEGCAEKPAVQVHHLTYRRFRREMLFDLVAVCEVCHTRIHAEMDESKSSEVA